ncbi:MAG: nicotinate phosphoribosyltransferase [SAR202 cluster bacterium Io17-Chloro-G7]|nr:MAG: nicotinate phosphoribosyltransferase [SAR202 cluster bacterium Io17-Chloro-G7]
MEHPDLPLPVDDLGLFADLYELTMAQAYFDQGMAQPATFSLFIRNYPADRGYFVAAGLQDVLEYLANLSFSPSSVDYLRSLGSFSDEFLEFLSALRFTGSVRAIPEGRIFFADEPPLEVTAPIIEAQLVETFIVNQINLQTLLATKASRCVWAAPGKTISDFASRRTQGTDAALKMARCSYIGGFQSTSNVLAAKRYGIPPAGTMAHSFVSSFASELEAFRAYAQAFPGRSILLLDTHDTVNGAHTAAKVAKEMESEGHRLVGVRLDSGDFESLSRQVRRILDESNLGYVRIVASGGLDEFELESLYRADAPIDMYGVGTKAGVSADAPWSDMAYKLVCYDGRGVMKLSVDKESKPGAKQVFRFTGGNGKDGNGEFVEDVVGLQDENMEGSEPLLRQVMTDGRLSSPHPSLSQVREQFEKDFAKLDDKHKALSDPPKYPVSFSQELDRMTTQVRKELSG